MRSFACVDDLQPLKLGILDPRHKTRVWGRVFARSQEVYLHEHAHKRAVANRHFRKLGVFLWYLGDLRFEESLFHVRLTLYWRLETFWNSLWAYHFSLFSCFKPEKLYGSRRKRPTLLGYMYYQSFSTGRFWPVSQSILSAVARLKSKTEFTRNSAQAKRPYLSTRQNELPWKTCPANPGGKYYLKVPAFWRLVLSRQASLQLVQARPQAALQA